MAETLDYDLAGFVLPAAGPHLRDHVRPPERRTAVANGAAQTFS